MKTYLFFTPSDVDTKKLRSLTEAKGGGWLPDHDCGFISGGNKAESSIYVRIHKPYPEKYDGDVRNYVMEKVGKGPITAVEIQVSGAGDDSALLHDFYYAMYYCWKGFLWNGEVPAKLLAG